VAHGPQSRGDQTTRLLVSQGELSDQFAQDNGKVGLVEVSRGHGDQRLVELESVRGCLDLEDN